MDAEIRKFLPLLGNNEKRSLLDKIKSLLHIADAPEVANSPKPEPSGIDYSQYRFPVAAVKFDRGEINER